MISENNYTEIKDDRIKTIFSKVLNAAFECFGFDRKIELKYINEKSNKNAELILSDNEKIIISENLMNYLNTHFKEYFEDAAAIMLAHEIAHLSNNDYTTKQFIRKNIKDIGERRNAYIKLETDADKTAIFICLKAGYNPKYLVNILRKFYADFESDIEHPYYIRIMNANETYKNLYLAYNLFFDGIHYFNNKRYTEALQKFILFNKFFPNHKASNNNIAMIFYKDAVKEFYRNYTLETDIDLEIGFANPQILMRGAENTNYKSLGKINKFSMNRAINILENLTARYPDYWQGLNNLACMYIDSGEYDKAETVLNKMPADYKHAAANKDVLINLKNNRRN